MQVCVWVRGLSASKVEVFLHVVPLAPRLTEPIDATQQSFDSCLQSLKVLSCASEMGRKQRNGRHIKARSVEFMEADIDVATDDLLEVAKRVKRWSSRLPRSLSLHGSLTLEATLAVHFLCLLRSRIAGGSIMAEVWARIVHELLPCVSRFGYAPTDPGILPWVELRSLPPLPGSDEATLLHPGQQRDIWSSFAADGTFGRLRAAWYGECARTAVPWDQTVPLPPPPPSVPRFEGQVAHTSAPAASTTTDQVGTTSQPLFLPPSSLPPPPSPTSSCW